MDMLEKKGMPFIESESPQGSLESQPEPINCNAALESGQEAASKQIQGNASGQVEELPSEEPRNDQVSQGAYQQAMRSLLQQGFKNLYQESLIDQLRSENNQAQALHAMSSSTMSRSFTGKLLYMAVQKQMKAEQQNKVLKEKMHIMELKEEKAKKDLNYQLHCLG